MSNESWSKKTARLGNHTALRLNWELLQNYPEEWNEETIRERSKYLAGIVAEIWPHSDSL